MVRYEVIRQLDDVPLLTFSLHYRVYRRPMDTQMTLQGSWELHF